MSCARQPDGVASGSFSARGGSTRALLLRLTPRARAYFRAHRSLRTAVSVATAERPDALTSVLAALVQHPAPRFAG